MKRQNILIIVLAALLVLAAALYFFVVRPLVSDGGEDEPEPVETEEGENLSAAGTVFMFAGMSREDVEYIKVDNEYGEFRFVSSGDGDFVIDGYDSVPYDKNLFASLLNVSSYTLSKT